jgi:hypothetical protein
MRRLSIRKNLVWFLFIDDFYFLGLYLIKNCRKSGCTCDLILELGVLFEKQARFEHIIGFVENSVFNLRRCVRFESCESDLLVWDFHIYLGTYRLTHVNDFLI